MATLNNKLVGFVHGYVCHYCGIHVNKDHISDDRKKSWLLIINLLACRQVGNDLILHLLYADGAKTTTRKEVIKVPKGLMTFLHVCTICIALCYGTGQHILSTE